MEELITFHNQKSILLSKNSDAWKNEIQNGLDPN